MAREDNEILHGCQIRWPNFEGREGPYNRPGDRNFSVVLTPEKARELKKKGWNVKEKGNEEGSEEFTLPVAVSFPRHKDGTPNVLRAPKIVLVTSKGRTELDEETCELIDWTDIASVDAIVRPYDWSRDGRSGRKAYLKTLVVVIDEDPVLQKYEHLEQLNFSAQPALPGGRDQLALPAGSSEETDDEEDIIDVEIVRG